MMNNHLLNLLSGRRTHVDALVLVRGETFMETIEDEGMAILVFFSGQATITRQRQGEQVGLHLTPQLIRPVFLTSPGTYCVTAKDSVVGARYLRMGGSK
jgi:hypothetical protein